MAITIKDFLATLLAGLSAYIYYAQYNAIHIPLFDSYRGPILAVAILGMILCEFGFPRKFKYVSSQMMMSILGIISFLLIFLGLISGNQTIHTYTTGIIIAIWLISTFRHMFNI